MGVQIYNPADLAEIQKWRDAAIADVEKTFEILDFLEVGTVAQAEAIATIYEDNLKRQNQLDEVLATIYEAILDGGAL